MTCQCEGNVKEIYVTVKIKNYLVYGLVILYFDILSKYFVTCICLTLVMVSKKRLNSMLKSLYKNLSALTDACPYIHKFNS